MPRRHGHSGDGSSRAREIELWRAVLRRALADASRDVYLLPLGRARDTAIAHREQARVWLGGDSHDFRAVCSLAGLDHVRVKDHIDIPADAEWRRIRKD